MKADNRHLIQTSRWQKSRQAGISVKMLVTQSCLILCDPMNCSLPESSPHGIFQAILDNGVGCRFLQQIFPTQRSKLGLLHCRQILYHQSLQISRRAQKLLQSNIS